MTHVLALLLIPILWGRRRSKTIHVCSTLGSSLSLPGKYVSRRHLALSLRNSVGQLTDRRLQPQVDLQHSSELHILGWTSINSFLLKFIPSLI
jgi:pSer/pThr/pTyr-binding forkhead associated (FHA) protein